MALADFALGRPNVKEEKMIKRILEHIKYKQFMRYLHEAEMAQKIQKHIETKNK